jgi:hypothetical protein
LRIVRYLAVCHKEGSQISWLKNLPLKGGDPSLRAGRITLDS